MYHAFYVWAYGNERKYECFADEASMLAMVKRANDPDDGVRDLKIVSGELLEFEPCQIVESWRIKEKD
jgi:hypothetical protein